MSELRASFVLRATRGSLTAAVAMMLAIAAHTMAGGLLPSFSTLAAVGIVLAVATSVALARPASVWRLVVLVAGGQFAVHTVLTATSGHKGDQAQHRHPTSPAMNLPGNPHGAAGSPPATGSDRSGSFYDLTMTPGIPGRPVGESTTELPHWLTHVLADLTGPHALMALAHLLAAAGVACWLAAGETALWTLIALLGVAASSWIRKLVAATTLGAARPILTPAKSAHARPEDHQPALRWLGPTLSRRGPPALA